MANIQKTFVYGAGIIDIVTTELDGNDTFIFDDTRVACLVLKNHLQNAVNVNIEGDESGVVDVDGIGEVDVDSGYNTGDIAPGEIKIVRLDKIFEYLQGNISVTGGAGLVAYILEFI